MIETIAIFGYYRSAVEVASYLRSREYRIIIIDSEQGNLAKARNMGFETAHLDYRDDAELKRLHLGGQIGTAFCLFPDDAENVYLTITLRSLAPALKIFTIAHGQLAVPKLLAAGADKVIDTYEITGRRIWDILKHPDITEILDHTLFGQSNLSIAELPVIQHPALLGESLAAAAIDPAFNLLVVGSINSERDNALVFAPTAGSYTLGKHDILIIIGASDDIERYRQGINA